MKTEWCISWDYDYRNTRSVLKKIHHEKYKILCGVNIYDTFRITDRDHSVQSKVQLFDQYISGKLGVTVPDIQAIEDVTKAFILRACGKATKLMRNSTMLSLTELLAQCNISDEKIVLDMKCIFSSNYLMSLAGKISTPPTRAVCRAYSPRKLRLTEKGFISMESMIAQYYSHRRASDEYYMWYELDDPFDLEMCVLNENLHLILSRDAADLRNFAYYINHVHIGRELCAVCNNVGSQSELIYSLNADFAGQPFVPFREEMISEMHL